MRIGIGIGIGFSNSGVGQTIDTNALILKFDDIGNTPVSNPASVSDWNTFFDLPTNGGPFSSVSVNGNSIYLYGGADIVVTNGGDYTNNLFSDNQNLVRFEDKAGSVIGFGDGLFYNANNCTVIIADSVLTASNYVFGGDDDVSGTMKLQKVSCNSLVSSKSLFWIADLLTELSLNGLQTIEEPNTSEHFFESLQALPSMSLPSLTDIADNGFGYLVSNQFSLSMPILEHCGSMVGDNMVFEGMSGKEITLTIPSALMTCNDGEPDGDIQYLVANNTVTIIQV